MQLSESKLFTIDDKESKMTLLEILIRDLPSRGGWPDWAYAVGMSREKILMFMGEGYDVKQDDGYWDGYFGVGECMDNDHFLDCLATDYESKIVSRSEYMSATNESTMTTTKPEVKPEIHEIYESYKQQRETTADAQRALDASKDAEDAFLEQIRQWNLQYGFDVRLLDESEEKPNSELVITDWQDLQAGDIIWWSGGAKYSQGEYTVENVSKGVRVFTWDGAEYVDTNHAWKFIRRPQ